MRNIGLSALGENSERSLENIAKIIRKEKFDIVALQEVLSEGKAFFLKDYARRSILMELGGEQMWGFSWADAKTAGLDRRHEGYAFIWNKQRMRLAETILPDGTVRVSEPSICEVHAEGMFRKPYYARFTPAETGASSLFELRLLCVHTYYGPSDNAESRARRQNEIDILLKEIYPQIDGKVYHGKDSYNSVYTIVLGDYNAELYRSWHDNLGRKHKPMHIKTDDGDVIIAKEWDGMRVKTVQDQLTTLKRVKEDALDQLEEAEIEMEANDSNTSRYANNYDHFSFKDDPRYNSTMKYYRVDAVRKYYEDKNTYGKEATRKYLKEVSDHIPIMLEIELN